MLTNAITELDELLEEGVAGAARRERTEFDRLSGHITDSLVIFGAGKLGRTIRNKLMPVGIEPLAFTDNNEKLWGCTVEGIPVLSPVDVAARFGRSATFVIAVWGVGSKDRMSARVRQLQILGCRTVLSFPALFWKYPELFLPYHVIDKPQKVQQEAGAVRAAYDLWADEFSRNEYIAQLKWRLQGDFDSMADPVSETIYFPRDVCTLREREVFVDCGAFDGDTVASFLGSTNSVFQQAVAYEPDPANFAKLQQYVATLDAAVSARIRIEQKAVGSSTGKVRFLALGTDGSAIGEGNLEVECVALDDVLGDQIIPTHIKMDIEGAELDALEGSRRLIARHAPVLAICSYHNQADLWRIPLLIHSFNPEYRLYLRPHLIEGWDVVCYAVSPHRRTS